MQLYACTAIELGYRIHWPGAARNEGHHSNAVQQTDELPLDSTLCYCIIHFIRCFVRLLSAVLHPAMRCLPRRASRGVDSIDVDQVVLFDFPRDPSEYLRRVGRTARGAGGVGTVYVLALGGQVGLARRIMARNDKGLPVHKVLDDFF